jgi:NAD dependent epimerase/dehydratase family enzyme
MSWIHRDDLVDLIVEALKNPQYRGIYNATAPQPVRMGELCGALGNILGRPSWLPVPDFALQVGGEELHPVPFASPTDPY